MDLLGSEMQNKYSRVSGEKYYGGNEIIGRLSHCAKRALESFGLDPEKWGCRVQSFVGSWQNLLVPTAVFGSGW